MGSPTQWFWILLLGVAFAGVTYLFWRVGRTRNRPLQLDLIGSVFRQERANLQTRFFQAAAASGKPRGLRWKECQWSELIEFARDRATGQLLALVGVTIAFEAIEGSDMEGVEAVGNLRNASAVFFFHDGSWHTVGRVIFNLNPSEVLTHFKTGYERVTV